jgi:2-oxoglutarate ferredoxin oxidoreductase subunit delta
LNRSIEVMKKKGRIEVDRSVCKGCYLCVEACPLDLLEKDTVPVEDGTLPAKWTDPEGKCVACGNCYTVCPDAAITVWEEES